MNPESAKSERAAKRNSKEFGEVLLQIWKEGQERSAQSVVEAREKETGKIRKSLRKKSR